MVTILSYCLFLGSLIFDRARGKWIGRSVVEVNIENERFLFCVDVVVKTLNLEISRCHLADYVK